MGGSPERRDQAWLGVGEFKSETGDLAAVAKIDPAPEQLLESPLVHDCPLLQR